MFGFVSQEIASAAAAGDVKAVQEYLDGNPHQLENRTVFQSNLLHIAARNGHPALVRELLQRGIDMNALDFGGMRRTALHWACQSGHVEIVEILVDHGANTKIWCSHDILDQRMQVQGRAWSQLVQGKRCGWLVDQDTPFEDSPAALCSSHAVQLALERPPWSPQLNSMWPQRFKEMVRLLLMGLHQGQQSAAGRRSLSGDSTVPGDVPGAGMQQQQQQRERKSLPLVWDACQRIIAEAAYPISMWV